MTAATQKAGKAKRIPKLSREQIREGLEAFPIDQLLNIPPGSKGLTKKQRDFAEAVAIGKTMRKIEVINYKAKTRINVASLDTLNNYLEDCDTQPSRKTRRALKSLNKRKKSTLSEL